MTPDRGPVTHCAIPGCVLLGHFTPYEDLCPIHREEVTIPPPNPDL